jgi:hypothetical protein
MKQLLNSSTYQQLTWSNNTIVPHTSTNGMWNYCVIAACQLLVCVTIVLLLHVNWWYVELLCYCFMSTVGLWNYCYCWMSTVGMCYYCAIAACQLLVCGTIVLLLIVLLLHVNCWFVGLLCYCFMSTSLLTWSNYSIVPHTNSWHEAITQ